MAWVVCRDRQFHFGSGSLAAWRLIQLDAIGMIAGGGMTEGMHHAIKQRDSVSSGRTIGPKILRPAIRRIGDARAGDARVGDAWEW